VSARPAELVGVAQPGARGTEPPGLAADLPTTNAAVIRCRTRFENAHGTVLRKLLYPWRPWFELQVFIHEAIEKPEGIVFRCTASGSEKDRGLEVPAWMFERASYPDHAQLTAAPFIGMTALSALASLLRQVLKDQAASSNAPLSGASKSSHDQNRRGNHVNNDVSAVVNHHEGKPLTAAHYWLPAGRRRFVEIIPGIAVTLTLWLLAGAGFVAYLGAFADRYIVIYAGLASVMIALAFLYFSAAIFIYGGDLNAALMRRARDNP
jgi:hypothetical protein